MLILIGVARRRVLNYNKHLLRQCIISADRVKIIASANAKKKHNTTRTTTAAAF